MSICLLAAGFLCAGETRFSIRLTTSRQAMKLLTVGVDPASFHCKTSALTNGLLVVPDIPLLKDHVKTEGRSFVSKITL